MLTYTSVFRMTLLLGPPGAGKTTLLLALAGNVPSGLKVLNYSFYLLEYIALSVYHTLGSTSTKCNIATAQGIWTNNIQWPYHG